MHGNRDWTDFSGVAGRVVREAGSFGTMLTGMTLGLVFFVTGFVIGKMEAFALAMPAMQVLTALALCRFAIAGMHGEFGGSLFTGAGGGWHVVPPVALRYLALTGIWLLPLLAIGHDEFGPQMLMSLAMGAGLGTAATVVIVYMVLSIVTPPIFLAVATRADSFGDIFSPEQWGSLFRGRLSDLRMIYVVYIGTLGLFMLFAMPVVLLVSIQQPEFGRFLALMTGLFMLGLATTVLGRLAGFYAFGEPETTMPAPADAPGHGPGGAPAGPAPEPQGAARVMPVSIPLTPEAAVGGKPPLSDPAGDVRSAWQAYERDPQRGIAQLESLRESHAPHPKVLHGLALMRFRAGQQDEAAEIGREAISVCVKRAAMPLASELIRELWPLMGRVKPDRGDLSRVATSMVPDGDLAVAMKTFAVLVRNDPTDAKAIKGLMKIGELKLERGEAAEAIKLYQFLIKHCPQSPLAEYFQQGLQAAQAA